MNKQDYEIFADCRIKINGDYGYERLLYIEIENLSVSSPEHPLKIRFIKPTEKGLIYLDDGSVKTIGQNWWTASGDTYYEVDYFAEHNNKHYVGLQSLWIGIIEFSYGIPQKHLFELESIDKAIQKTGFFKYKEANDEENEFPEVEVLESYPKIKDLVKLQNQMNHDLAIAAKQSKKAEPEMER